MIKDIFILTNDWYDAKGKHFLQFIGTSEEGPVEVHINKSKPVFFIKRETKINNMPVPFLRKEVELNNFSFENVDALYFNTQRDLKTAVNFFDEFNTITYEADVDPARRYLMERVINVQMRVSGEAFIRNKVAVFNNPQISPASVTPKFTVASIDIETGAKNTKLYSIAVHLTGKECEVEKVFMLSEESFQLNEKISFFSSERILLETFIKWFEDTDPDIIIGWHVIGFDLMFLEEKCNSLKIPFNIGRGKRRISLKNRKGGGYFANIPGRIVIDGPVALRSSFYTFEDYKLETVAQNILGIGKIISSDQNKIEEIERLFKSDKKRLAEYNLQDAVLVTKIFAKTGIIDMSVKRSQLSGLLMDQLGMMTAAFDHFYLPKLHRAGYVAPNINDIKATEHAAGGFVIDPLPGIYDDVVVLDFKSLYPSIIQTFKIDPLSRLRSDINTIKTPAGYKFSRTENFLPDFIGNLMQQRAEAKLKGDMHLSQAIKILMNSFYGVMGSSGCRFYHHQLPTGITSTGKYLLLGSKKFLEKMGYTVVYGDTDSLFVKLKKGEGELGEQKGNNLAETLNIFWADKLQNEFQVQSFLEIEYEKFYKKYIITPARGAETGAKKRYAGLIVKNGKQKLEFVGMEFVRSDWTLLAKQFQVELYSRIFNDAEIRNWIRNFVADVNRGVYDEKLVYTKRLRKNIEQYTKNIPPQVKAAKLNKSSRGIIKYVITKRGPIPVELEHSDIDYSHYIEKQIKPIADSVLVLLGLSFDSIIGTEQLSFF